MGKIYAVAEGAAFVANGVTYGAGDKIDSDVFNKEALERALKTSEKFPKGKLIDEKVAAVAAAPNKPSQPEEKSGQTSPAENSSGDKKDGKK